MAYTDKEMLLFSQIAYLNIDDYYNKAANTSNNKTVTLADIKKSAKNNSALMKKFNEISEKAGNDDWLKWSISGIHNNNEPPNGNGFYACIIETSPGNAAVGFRGSETMDTLFKVKTDWVDADLKLLNSTLTTQQNECDIFMQKYADKLAGYDNLAMVGHSLGGNLAEYSTIVSHKYGLDGKIKQCMSLDGPGFSDEFIRLHREEIEKMAPVMKHRRWSFVGTMLNDLPGVDYMYCKTNGGNIVTKHDTKYVELDGDDFVKGKQDWFSWVTDKLSKGIDHLPAPVGNAIITVVSGVWTGAMWVKENIFDKFKLNDFQKGLLAGIAIANLIPLLPTLIPLIGHIVLLGIAVIAAVIFFEFVYEFVEKAIKYLAEKIGEICKWAKDQVVKLVNFCIDLAKGIKKWFDKHFNAGYKYASNNPVVTFDTYKLNSFADRLYALNQRLINLDKRVDGLYSKLSPANKLQLQKVDYDLGSNKFITKSAQYLKEVVTIYESAEREISSKLEG